MKYVIIIFDGCVDELFVELNGWILLEVVEILWMDFIVVSGIVG